MIDSIEELYKGLTDLPIALLAIIFGVLLFRKKNECYKVFALLSISAILGAFAHSINLSKVAYIVTWAILYIFLYELVKRASQLICEYLEHEKVCYPKIINISEVILYIASVVFLFMQNDLDIYCLVVFGVVCIVWIVKVISARTVPSKLWYLLVFAVLALCFQGLKTIIPNGVVLGHVMILFAVGFLYAIALEIGNNND